MTSVLSFDRDPSLPANPNDRPTQARAVQVPLRLLLVDDSGPVLDVAEDLMADIPWVEVVGRASTGLEALDSVDRLRPDLILMDLSMPEMGGLEATRRLRQGPGRPRIVLMTAHDSPEYRDAAEEAGADSFLVKDNLADTLLTLMARMPR